METIEELETRRYDYLLHISELRDEMKEYQRRLNEVEAEIENVRKEKSTQQTNRPKK